MVEERSGQPSEAEKEGGTEKTEQQTILDGFPYRLADCSLISGGIRFRNDGKEEDGNGVGNGGGKQDQREGHSCQYAVYAQCFGIIISVAQQTLRDINSLYALQEINQGAV